VLKGAGDGYQHNATTGAPPNKPFQLTASREIVAILRLSRAALAAAERQGVGRQAIIQVAIKSHIIATLLHFSKTISLDAP